MLGVGAGVDTGNRVIYRSRNADNCYWSQQEQTEGCEPSTLDYLVDHTGLEECDGELSVVSCHWCVVSCL